jgi:hypothetical protein
VQLDSWGTVMKTEPSDKLAAVRDGLGAPKSWWWD